MQPLYIIILTFFICVNSNAQTAKTGDLETYGYDTTLKRGYNISFTADDSMQHLFLKKNGKRITELASTSRGMPYKNLGYLGADFNDYFVLIQSYGSGNPNYIELIKKATGKNILKKGAAWIDVDKKNGFLLYSENDVPNPKNKMILYNIRNGQKELFDFPSDIFGEPQILNRIRIQKLSDNQLVIKYHTKKCSTVKLYSR